MNSCQSRSNFAYGQHRNLIPIVAAELREFPTAEYRVAELRCCVRGVERSSISEWCADAPAAGGCYAAPQLRGSLGSSPERTASSADPPHRKWLRHRARRSYCVSGKPSRRPPASCALRARVSRAHGPSDARRRTLPCRQSQAQARQKTSRSGRAEVACAKPRCCARQSPCT